jgi:2-polyprenyl-3-methyl-5-hydroxy-6-metoxy-1,4-benzoquinol methylase
VGRPRGSSERRSERLLEAAGDYVLEPGGVRRVRFLLEQAARHRGGADGSGYSALDVGCGRGNLTAALARSGIDSRGIDLDEDSIAAAERMHADLPCGFATADVADAPDASYDLVVLSEVLEHLDDPSEMVRQLARVSRPGALVVITVPNGWCLEEILRRLAVRTTAGRALRRAMKPALLRSGHVQSENIRDCPHIQFFTRGRLRSVFSSNGFVVVAQEGSGYFFREAFYLLLRFFLPRDSGVFGLLDAVDDRLADAVPLSMASGWMFALRRP